MYRFLFAIIFLTLGCQPRVNVKVDTSNAGLIAPEKAISYLDRISYRIPKDRRCSFREDAIGLRLAEQTRLPPYSCGYEDRLPSYFYSYQDVHVANLDEQVLVRAGKSQTIGIFAGCHTQCIVIEGDINDQQRKKVNEALISLGVSKPF